MLLVILMIKLIFHINCYELMHKFGDFVKFLQIIPQLMKLSKTQLDKIGQSGAFLGRLLGPLLKTCLPLMEKYLNH